MIYRLSPLVVFNRDASLQIEINQYIFIPLVPFESVPLLGLEFSI